MKAAGIFLATLTVILAGIGGAEAQRLNYPYCAVYGFRTESCAFNTMAQCLMTVSGRGGFCQANAWYVPPAKAKSRKRTS